MEEAETIADALVAAMAESDPESEEASGISEEATAEVDETEDEVVEVEAAEEDDDESEEQETVFQAPEHWSSDERTKFETLPPEAQEVLLERDKAFQTGYQEKAQAISAITEAIEPFKETLIRKGMSAPQAIGLLLNAQDQLDKDPMSGILQIAQNYGVVDQLKQRFAPETDDYEDVDPGLKALQQEIQGLKSQIEQTNQGIEKQQTQTVQQQIESFQNAKNDKGELLHPYFEDAMPMILASVQSGDTLESAYNKAKWTVDAYRDSQTKNVVEKTDAEKAKKVKQAKRAARGVKLNGKAAPEEGVEAMTLEEDLTEAFRQHSS